ncbi:MAG: hypothetical protein CM1200mP29_12350 [Verrucomicrobiota bacterium]|nr:MAG: hypothetical protein CM1200mP29_12350 [Verrucomicrobiota bacterium]
MEKNRKLSLRPGRFSNNDYAGNFAEFLAVAKLDKSRPWVFWYGATEPHRGYEAGVGRRMRKKAIGY